jgi:hypothetical protein
MNGTHGFGGFAAVQRGCHGTTSGAHFTTIEIAMEKDIFRAGVAEDIDAGKAGYFFGAVTPENYFFLQIKDADPDLQAVEDVAVNFRILKGRHGSATSSGANGFIGEEAFRLKRMALCVPKYRAQGGESLELPKILGVSRA